MIIDTGNKIIRKLEEQEQEEGALPLLLQFYRELVQIQSGTEERIGTPNIVISSEAINKYTAKGLPLLSFDRLDINWVLLQDVFARVGATFAKYPELFGDIPERFQTPGAGRLLTKRIAAAWFKGKPLPQATLTKAVNNNLNQAIIHAALKPFLTSHAKTLIGFINQENWRRSFCPICGGAPDFAYLDTERGSRWLLCSRCDTEWLFQRLGCPYCNTQNQDDLTYYTDEEGLYRLYVCEHCHRYLKTIDLQKATTEALLPLERLYTLDLDKQAQQKGYTPYT